MKQQEEAQKKKTGAEAKKKKDIETSTSISKDEGRRGNQKLQRERRGSTRVKNSNHESTAEKRH